MIETLSVLASPVIDGLIVGLVLGVGLVLVAVFVVMRLLRMSLDLGLTSIRRPSLSGASEVGIPFEPPDRTLTLSRPSGVGVSPSDEPSMSSGEFRGVLAPPLDMGVSDGSLHKPDGLGEALERLAVSVVDLYPANRIFVRCANCRCGIAKGEGYRHIKIGSKRTYCRSCQSKMGLAVRAKLE